MSSSTTKPTEKPVEHSIKLHKRRSEDEMRGALAAFVTGKARQRDDEWEVILSDAISEVIESRRILIQVSQTVAIMQQEVTTSIQSMGHV